MEGVHHCSGSNELHLSRLLEDGLRERVWGDCDVVRPGGEWRGWITANYSDHGLPVSLAITFSLLQEVCQQYWPGSSTNRVQKYGEYSVSVLQVTEQDDFIERVISITNPKVVDKEHLNTNNCSRSMNVNSIV